MMKKMIIFTCVLLFIAIALFEYVYSDQISEWFPSHEVSPIVYNAEQEETSQTEEESVNGEDSDSNEEKEVTINSESELFIGQSEAEIVDQFGEPERKDLSSYGYEWWVYPLSESSYAQLGIENEEVVTGYFIGDIVHDLPIEWASSYEEMDDIHTFEEQVSARNSWGHFQFELSDEDQKIRPLVQHSDDVWIQFYFDQHTNQVSSIRIFNHDVLIKQRPYSVSYRGELPEELAFTEEEQKLIESGEEKQIFDVTNIIRHRHDLDPFDWDEPISEVAYLHSMDMFENQYFSHVSPQFGELGDRIEAGDISPRLAGENIAAHYVDGIAAVEGWLNSEGHRVNLLHEEFTHLGVGVHQDYFTQNFLTPWLQN
ncbi:CAP domain-containing protein [Alkalihalobacillus trypoxylicola]|uniref:SCP-like extracellular n=1 Tax=Alkalihalobacillus trypoxylicola TaxID=519424 RepID=A0A162FBB2_9BACI|nr:CAP domain-containing protein [Alkalihalobacillus trypoxylicola]KYG35204.1 hypothetical protein AZF04_02370 [Alkalihalobacillus trypoxylicola]